jgi:serine-type D-Ala-D-Ala carboxypeptidase/endopeptidase (penicillin-binding protein 4)
LDLYKRKVSRFRHEHAHAPVGATGSYNLSQPKSHFQIVVSKFNSHIPTFPTLITFTTLISSRLKPQASCFPLFFLLIINSLNAQSGLPANASLKQFLDNKELRSAHVGVYVYDDSSKKVIAEYQSDKYFVPASNTKLFSLYAGMKYLGDSLTGINYVENDTAIMVFPTGDPSLLHPDFQSQPVIDFLKKTSKKLYLADQFWQETAWGQGWAWDDYNDDYSVERSQFPVYGNFIRWTQHKSPFRSNASFPETASVSSSPEISWPVRFSADSLPKEFLVKRLIDSNVFTVRLGDEADITQDVPFITNDMNSAAELLKDTLGKQVNIYRIPFDKFRKGWHTTIIPDQHTIYSRPVDSVFVPMMYRSDNFFAEQTLLMVSKKNLDFMKDESIIEQLLAIPLSDLPQKPSWVDGSGLSRYNLFTPQDFVTLLIKFKNEFGMDRMKRILPTGGKGTLKNHYLSGSDYVFAKTGSMNGVVCLSGYVYTIKKHLLEFSILVNNEMDSAPAIRREIETYVESLRRNN